MHRGICLRLSIRNYTQRKGSATHSRPSPNLGWPKFSFHESDSKHLFRVCNQLVQVGFHNTEINKCNIQTVWTELQIDITRRHVCHNYGKVWVDRFRGCGRQSPYLLSKTLNYVIITCTLSAANKSIMLP